ncbi:putative beta-glucosidase [Helianthus annuus]|nr:putative beta-glucosidase [Helianthus annuus]
MQDDIELIADTGLEAFRFSISWSRLIPRKTTLHMLMSENLVIGSCTGLLLMKLLRGSNATKTFYYKAGFDPQFLSKPSVEGKEAGLLSGF